MRVKLAALTLVIGSLLLLPSRATADTFQYSYTTPALPLVDSINITFTISAATPPTSGEVISPTSNDPVPVDYFFWNSAASGNCGFSPPVNFPGSACAGFYSGTSGSFDDFPAGSFLSPGTYTSNFDGVTFVITDLSTGTATDTVPAPSSLLLLGCGLFGLLAIASFRVPDSALRQLA